MAKRGNFTVRLLHRKSNTTVEVQDRSILALVDMAVDMVRNGELDAFSVARNR